MNGYKICLALVLVAILFLAIVSPAPTSAGPNRVIFTSKFYGFAGDNVDVRGQDWAAGNYTVTFAFGTSFARNVVSSIIYDTGIIAANFPVPEIPGGQYTIRVSATGSTGTTETWDEPFRIDPKVALNKTSDIVGTAATISGNGFGASKSVTIRFDDVQVGTATTNATGGFSNANFTVPESSYGGHTIRAIDAGGLVAETSWGTRQTMAVTPTGGSVGSKVTVNGSGFLADIDIIITFDSTTVGTIRSSAKGSFSTTFNVPVSASGSHEIKASDGSNEGSKVFTTSATININPTSGYTGTEVTVIGVSFQASKPITIGFGSNASIASTTSAADGGFNVKFKVPALNGGTYKIKASDGTNTKEIDFTILTSATLSAATGNVGSNVTVSGVGFIANSTATIKYDNNQIATTTVSANGTFSVTLTIPPSAKGAHTITATEGTNNIPLTFTMESTPPPVPKLLKPEARAKAKTRPIFDWEDVSDPSGVTYTLRIASGNFTDNSTILAKSGLTKSDYTLTSEEKLKSVKKDKPYYWWVRAVDGANNTSSWSEARAFYMGGFSLSLPSFSGFGWVKYLLYALGVIVILLVGFWIGRMTSYY